MKTIFLENKLNGCCNLCGGLPSPVSHCKYMGIKEYVLLAPDLKTSCALRLNQQPRDQTNTVPAECCVLSSPADTPIQTQTASCWIEGDCHKLTHSGKSKWEHIFYREWVAVLSSSFSFFASNFGLLIRILKRSKTRSAVSHSQQALWEKIGLSSA